MKLEKRSALDFNREWQPYLTRPFNLFATSLWQAWYDSEYMQEALGFKMDEVLCVEISRNLVRQYRTKTQLELLSKNFRNMLLHHPQKLESLLDRGLHLARKADLFLNGEEIFSNFEQAISFFNELIFFTTVFPNFPSIVLGQDELLPHKIKHLCEELRKTSYYPVFMKKFILPMALQHCQLSSLDNVTLNEVLSGKIVNRSSGSGMFVYQKLKGKETVLWFSDTGDVVERLEGKFEHVDVIKGLSTYPGIVSGTVHLVRDFMHPGTIKKGEILVSISANPSILPLIKQSAALVSDEGGVTSHAAIISREFKIPCIIGTRIATSVFKDGDLVEVDADKGIVRKIK